MKYENKGKVRITMSYKKTLKEISEGRVKSIYVCCGQETYLVQQFIDGIITRLIDPIHKDFAISKYDLTNTSIQSVIEDVETLPFMVPKKIVIAQNAAFLTGAKEGTKALKIEHDIERLLDYIQLPVDYCILILTVQADKMDERKKLVKWLKELGCVISFQPLSMDDLSIWISVMAKKYKCTMDTKAIQSLIMNAGTNLERLASEIEKISLFMGSQSEITTEIIDRLVARNLEQNVFKMIEEIANLRLREALAIFYDLIRQREEPIKIMMLIARQFRIMLQVKSLGNKGYSQQQMATQLKIHPYVVKLAAEQGTRFDEKHLNSILNQLADLDYAMKTGRVEKVMGLELFLLKLVR